MPKWQNRMSALSKGSQESAAAIPGGRCCLMVSFEGQSQAGDQFNSSSIKWLMIIMRCTMNSEAPPLASTPAKKSAKAVNMQRSRLCCIESSDNFWEIQQVRRGSRRVNTANSATRRLIIFPKAGEGQAALWGSFVRCHFGRAFCHSGKNNSTKLTQQIDL